MSSRLSRRHLLAGAAGGLMTSAAPVAAETFEQWLAGLRKEAVARGIYSRTLDQALKGVSPIPRVIELDRKQPEGRLTFAEYRRNVITKKRVARGRELAAAHAGLLRRIQARYGVPGRVVVALWGIESSFGERQGSFSIIAALATLAHDGRRAAFFRKELLHALAILDAGDIAPERMIGSWAGAMGQCQFMPSTFANYAVDFDGDGRRDIWRSEADVLGSAANYLAGAGWEPGTRWGRAVSVGRELTRERDGLDHRASLARWQAAGVRLPDGGDLPAASMEASLLRMGGPGLDFLVYPNFRTIMVWNRSTYFALCVGLLSDLVDTG
jgi:membrane-bound lytic murein transglycosylase B